MKKKLNVVMLATQEKSNIFDVFGVLKVLPGNPDSTYESKNKHLYFTSDEKCKNGDYFIDLLNTVRQFNDKTEQSTNDKKIVITTDTSLYRLEDCPVRGGCSNVKYELPQPTKEFIDLYISEYNKGNIIKEVEVEYEEIMGDDGIIAIAFGEQDFKLKINHNNTVNISLIKDGFSREEVKTILFNLAKYYTFASCEEEVESLNKWIEENLK